MPSELGAPYLREFASLCLKTKVERGDGGGAQQCEQRRGGQAVELWTRLGAYICTWAVNRFSLEVGTRWFFL